MHNCIYSWYDRNETKIDKKTYDRVFPKSQVESSESLSQESSVIT